MNVFAGAHLVRNAMGRGRGATLAVRAQGALLHQIPHADAPTVPTYCRDGVEKSSRLKSLQQIPRTRSRAGKTAPQLAVAGAHPVRDAPGRRRCVEPAIREQRVTA
ncbi:MAG TPA: hypothetical protein VN043_16780 [Rhodanobacter sp.]|nr:hypothetical protein [Rhodanobacter sp.]